MFKNKSFKREVASALVGMLMWVIYNGNVPMTEVIIWPILSFASIAFGMSWMDKSGRAFMNSKDGYTTK